MDGKWPTLRPMCNEINAFPGARIRPSRQAIAAAVDILWLTPKPIFQNRNVVEVAQTADTSPFPLVKLLSSNDPGAQNCDLKREGNPIRSILT